MTLLEDQPTRFEPIHEAHAIEQAAVTLQFGRPIDPGSFKNAVAAFRQRYAAGDGAILPGDVQLQQATFGFQIGNLALGQPAQAGLSMGHMFSRTSPSGVVEKDLRLNAFSIAFRTCVYSRWADLAADAKGFLEVLLPFYGDSLPIASLGYSVVDKFIWKGPSGQCNPKLLLRPQSKYVCPHVFNTSDMWHSHTGVFLKEDASTKRLLNLNVDCVDEALPPGDTRTVVSITTVVTDSLNQPGYQPSTPLPQEEVAAFVSAKLNCLHSFSKSVFSETINDTMCRRIALVE